MPTVTSELDAGLEQVDEARVSGQLAGPRQDDCDTFVIPLTQLKRVAAAVGPAVNCSMENSTQSLAPLSAAKEITMKVRTLIAGAAVVLLCGAVGVSLAEDAPAAKAPSAEASPASSSTSAMKHHHHKRRSHHARKGHGQKEFTEQQLQEMSTQPSSK